MKPELKRYYLMQMAYWFQQLIVLLLKLEKPRKDYNELVAHHFVTLWLVGFVTSVFRYMGHFLLTLIVCSWSYLVNLTLIGHSVYLSMDLPDTLLAVRNPSPYASPHHLNTFAIALKTPQLHPMGNVQVYRLRHPLGCLVVSSHIPLTFFFIVISSSSSTQPRYFRLWLNVDILRSVWTEFKLIPYVAVPPPQNQPR